MVAPAEKQERDVGPFPDQKPALMAFHLRRNKARESPIGKLKPHFQLVRDRAKSASQNHRQSRTQFRGAAQASGRSFRFRTDRHGPAGQLDFWLSSSTLEAILKGMQLNNDEIRRYSRHLILPEVGLAGQKKICSTSVLCIGAGGLGSPIAMYLAAAGIGRLGLLDFDAVDFSNLQRQIIHSTADVGRPKIESARETIQGINPNVDVVLHPARITSENALEILSGYDIVVDGTDNFPTRYLTNDACVLLKKPNVYGSIFRFEGQASVFAPHLGGPCYRCLYPEPPPPGLVPSCAEGGVLGVLPGIVGCIQATEILKLALGKGTSLIGRLVLFNALDMKFRELKLRRDPKCPLCGENPTIKELIDYEQFCGIAPEPATPSSHPDEVTVQEMKQALESPKLGIKVLDVREPDEYQIARIKGVPLFPLSTLGQRFTELDPNQQYYFHCKAGIRSLKAVRFLKEHGFKYVKSVKGGITAWSDEIDASVPKY
jgi:molybdopterin/thiamine biosynthesis adenylyltransferase/rhodanese-related sulfurtransferase